MSVTTAKTVGVAGRLFELADTGDRGADAQIKGLAAGSGASPRVKRDSVNILKPQRSRNNAFSARDWVEQKIDEEMWGKLLAWVADPEVGEDGSSFTYRQGVVAKLSKTHVAITLTPDLRWRQVSAMMLAQHCGKTRGFMPQGGWMLGGLEHGQGAVVELRDTNLLFDVLHADLLLLVEWFRDEDEDNGQIYAPSGLMEIAARYLSLELGGSDDPESYRKKKNYQVERTSVLHVNKSSLYFKKATEKRLSVLRNSQLLVPGLKKRMTCFPHLADIEVQYDFDPQKLAGALRSVRNGLMKIKAFEKKHGFTILKEDCRFRLRIRKMRRSQKTGMFVKHMNVVLIDPRHMEDLGHEIGHWIIENMTPAALEKLAGTLRAHSDRLSDGVGVGRSKGDVMRMYLSLGVEKEMLADQVAEMFFKQRFK